MADLDDLEMMRVHVETLFVHDNARRLLWENRPLNPEAHLAPLVFAGRTQWGGVCRCRHDLPEDICTQVWDAVNGFTTRGLSEDRGLVSELKTIVGAYTHVGDTWTGPAYRFTDSLVVSRECVVIDRSNWKLLAVGFGDYIPELEVVQPCVVAVVDGRAVSICHSARRSAHADEAGVETLPEYRQRSLGASVVATWASLVREAGRMPLYTTSWSNTASQGLAAKLRLTLFGSDLHISERKASLTCALKILRSAQNDIWGRKEMTCEPARDDTEGARFDGLRVSGLGEGS